MMKLKSIKGVGIRAKIKDDVFVLANFNIGKVQVFDKGVKKAEYKFQKTESFLKFARIVENTKRVYFPESYKD